MLSGVQGFVEEMADLSPTVEDELVVYKVTPVDGAHAGSAVETGVSISELSSWPQTPPHWVHFPASVTFTTTNSQPSSRQGWVRHSRKIGGWGDVAPDISWTSHIRGILSEAIT